MTSLLLALLMAVSVAGILLGVRMIRADAKLPSDLQLALEVGPAACPGPDRRSTASAYASHPSSCV